MSSPRDSDFPNTLPDLRVCRCENCVVFAIVAEAQKTSPQGRISLAQHGAAGGVLGKVEMDMSPGRGSAQFPALV